MKKTLLEQVNELDNMIRQHQKMASKMEAGQFLQANRECHRIIAALQRSKTELLEEEGANRDDK